MYKSKKFLVAAVAIALAAAAGTVAFAAAGDISTIAGDGTSASAGDGGPATSASLKTPYGLAIDSAGNIYVVDEYGDVVRKIDTSGVISTYAGNGVANYGGDGNQATNASMETPRGIAFDAAGNLYICEYDSNRVRKVNTSGVISTFAGTGAGVYSGDGGAATSAEMKRPTGVAVDGTGNVYITDPGNHTIRKVNTSGIISTIAGDGTSGYTGDAGQSTSARVNGPTGITVDSVGNIYFSDMGNAVIRKIDTSGVITTIAGTGTAGFGGDGGAATSAQISGVRDIKVDSAGNIFFSDSTNHRIRKIDTSGNISTVIGDGTAAFTGDGGAASSAQVSGPYGLLIDPAGNLVIADRGNRRVRRVSLLATPAPTTTTTTTTTPPTTTIAPTTTATSANTDDEVDADVAESNLPQTGSSSTSMSLIAAVMTAAGLALVVRRRLHAEN